MRENRKNSLRAQLLAASLALASLGTAQAAAYVGAWDPKFGAPFDLQSDFNYDLGWRGEALFEVPSACIPSASGLQQVSAQACGAYAISALVELYDHGSPAAATLENFVWANTSLSPWTLDSLLFFEGELIGFDTQQTERQLSGLSFQGTCCSIYMSLGFEFQTQIGQADSSNGSNASTGPSAYNGPTLYWNTAPNGAGFAAGQNDRSIPISFTVALATPVPEPGAWAMLTAGLIGLGWRLRRARIGRAGV